jgi:TrpR-related protein YerC/YecD
MYTVKKLLTKQQQTNLFIKLAKALTTLKSSEEVAYFLKDLLSESEVLMLARRLQIAELLIEGLTYEQIKSEVKVSFGTIARVRTWLELYGDGYRTVAKRIVKKEQPDNSAKAFTKIKHKYPMYYWPQLLLEEIIKTANKREKQRLASVVEQLRDKTQLSRELAKLL